MPREPVLLLTGFEPFGGDTANPSEQVARALQGREIEGLRIESLVLPCAFGSALECLHGGLRRHAPALVLALGQAAGRCDFSLERVAINLDDARIPDNAGAQPIDVPVRPGGPPACFTTLPVKAMVAGLRTAGFPASLSLSAGSFVCNHVFYGLQLALDGRGARSGFMHLPLLPEQAAARPGAPSLPLQTLIDGVALALAIAVRSGDGDLRSAEGALA